MENGDFPFEIKDWHKFQHFKDRKPPWIKLYRDILDDDEWFDLSGDEAKVLVMLWLIASEYSGQLPNLKKLSFRIRMKQNNLESVMERLRHWVIRRDDNAISTRYQDDLPETETETEREKETEIEDTIVSSHSAHGTENGKKRADLAQVRKDIQAAWNVMASEYGLPKWQSWNEGRQAALRQRWTLAYWRSNWQEAITRVPANPWNLGENSRKWLANPDWFLRDKTVPALMESSTVVKKGTLDGLEL